MQNEIDKDLYEILGVSRTADAQEIKRAFRSRARECHPDVASHDPEGERKFKELSFAYEVLSDPQRRSNYDRWGLDGLRRGTSVDFDGFTSVADLFDVFFGGGFESPFGRRNKKRTVVHGRDMETSTSITLDEVIQGVEKRVEVERMATCEECDGSGMKPGSQMKTCSHCHGSGEILTSERSLFGTLIRSQTCPRCNGRGQVIEEPCARCGGEGRIRHKEELEIKIPPGVENGDRLHVAGKGEGGVRGGRPGDLYILIRVENHPLFRRDGRNLLAEVAVDMAEAALGCEVDMPSLDGDCKLKVPKGTQPGDVLKVKQKGLPPRYGGRRGDMLVRVGISVPKRVSTAQKRALEQYLEARKEREG